MWRHTEERTVLLTHENMGMHTEHEESKRTTYTDLHMQKNPYKPTHNLYFA